MITPCNFSICDTTTWVLDTESPINIGEDEQFLNIGDGSLVPVLTLETLQLVFESSSVMLDDCHYCPSYMMNVISVDFLTNLNYKFIIKDDFCDIIMNDTTILYG